MEQKKTEETNRAREEGWQEKDYSRAVLGRQEECG